MTQEALMGRPTDRTTTEDWEAIYRGDDDRRAHVYPPVGGALCSRCGDRADDVSFLIEGPTGTETAAGICAPCLVDCLRRFAIEHA
jgi:hypothetical protein